MPVSTLERLSACYSDCESVDRRARHKPSRKSTRANTSLVSAADRAREVRPQRSERPAGSKRIGRAERVARWHNLSADVLIANVTAPARKQRCRELADTVVRVLLVRDSGSEGGMTIRIARSMRVDDRTMIGSGM
jgi:hypothetical protein